MANELNLPLSPDQTGLTVTAVLILNNAAVGSPISCPESGTLPGHYSGDMPAVAEAVYGVRFLSAGSQIGTGIIDWTGTKERGLGDLPTVAEFNARSLPSADYFVVGDYTAPPTTEAIWTHTTRTLTSTALSAADVWDYSGRTLDGTQAANLASIASIPTNPLLTTDARLNTLDAAISTRLAALSYTEPLTILETASAVEDALTAYGAATPASVWGYAGRSLDGAQAATLATIEGAALAVTDGRFAIDYLNSTATQYDAGGASRTVFTLYDADGNLATTPESAVDRRPV